MESQSKHFLVLSFLIIRFSADNCQGSYEETGFSKATPTKYISLINENAFGKRGLERPFT